MVNKVLFMDATSSKKPNSVFNGYGKNLSTIGYAKPLRIYWCLSEQTSIWLWLSMMCIYEYTSKRYLSTTINLCLFRFDYQYRMDSDSSTVFLS